MADMRRRPKRDGKPTTAAETEIKPADREKKLTSRIDEQASEDFRRISFNKGVSMTEILTEAINDYIEKNRNYLR